jgi:hypothetical protein
MLTANTLGPSSGGISSGSSSVWQTLLVLVAEQAALAGRMPTAAAVELEPEAEAEAQVQGLPGSSNDSDAVAKLLHLLQVRVGAPRSATMMHDASTGEDKDKEGTCKDSDGGNGHTVHDWVHHCISACLAGIYPSAHGHGVNQNKFPVWCLSLMFAVPLLVPSYLLILSVGVILFGQGAYMRLGK